MKTQLLLTLLLVGLPVGPVTASSADTGKSANASLVSGETIHVVPGKSMQPTSIRNGTSAEAASPTNTSRKRVFSFTYG